MSAALQLPVLWAAASAALQPQLLASAVHHIPKRLPPRPIAPEPAAVAQEDPVVSWAFYRRHTERLLRRYLYASMQVGRSPNLLGESVGRGWVSSRRVRTFEDALIFVLDVERCLGRLNPIDRQIITRVVLQEYTHAEAAALIGVGVGIVSYRVPRIIDVLTEILVKADLLTVPN
jgi:hypothetical protein